jgi:hypothetical protein
MSGLGQKVKKRRNIFSGCFGRKKKSVPAPRIHTLESQYEFLSIASGLDSVFHSPRSSLDFAAAMETIHHHTVTLNGVRYHPYSALFSYNCDAALSLIHTESVPYDFAVYDALERELKLWVVNRHKDPPPSMAPLELPRLNDLHIFAQKRILEIYALAEEEEVLMPMQMLEQLRQDLSVGDDPKNPLSQLSEDERYRGLDFLVVDDTIGRLRWKYPRVKTVVGLIASIPSGSSKEANGWAYEECNGIDTWTRAEVDGSFSVRCRSVQQQPLFNAISLINEIDLHPLFMPHLSKAVKLHTIKGCGNRAQLLARYFYKMPFPVRDRDTVLFAFGCNATMVEGIEGVIISAQSVTGGLTDWWGYEVPPPDKLVRESLRGMSFVLKPIDDKHTEMTIIANLDKQVAFIPQSLMHYLIKDMIKGLYKNMIKLNLKFEKTEFANRVVSNPDFYDWVRHSLLRNAINSS